MRDASDIQVDPEFRAFIPPLSPDEYRQLRESIIASSGPSEPIDVWVPPNTDAAPIVIDGHNRLEIAREHGLPYQYRFVNLPDREAVKRWMFDRQVTRRNLSTEQIVLLASMRGIECTRGTPEQKRVAQALAASTSTQAEQARTAVMRGDLGLKSAAQSAGVIERRRRNQTHQNPASGAQPRIVREATPDELLRAQRAEDKAKASEQRAKALLDELKTTRSSLSAIEQLAAGPLPPVERREFGSGLREAAAVALLSDVHIEEIVEAHATPTGNEYNPQIADRALERFFAGLEWLIEFHRSAFCIRSLVLWLGGDLMTGHIHDEMVETTATSPIETMLLLKPRIIDGIQGLLQDAELDEVLIPCSYGNHGRNTRKPYRSRGAEHSYEWALYQDLAHHFEDEPRVHVLADRSAHQYVNVYEWKLHFHHGDEVNYYGGVGGIMIPMNKAIAQWDRARSCHYHHFGHFHQYLDAGNLVVNGSCIGFNAYAMSIKAAPEPPVQAFYLLDSKRGKTCKSPIWVRD